jgi:Uma2 family endonuclease
MIVESVSRGNELHDREIKRRWYGEFGVQNYWLLDSHGRSLECLRLQGAEFVTDQLGHDHDEVKPNSFPGLVIPLRDVWYK